MTSEIKILSLRFETWENLRPLFQISKAMNNRIDSDLSYCERNMTPTALPYLHLALTASNPSVTGYTLSVLSGHSMNLAFVFVEPAYRRQAIAPALIRQAVALGEGLGASVVGGSIISTGPAHAHLHNALLKIAEETKTLKFTWAFGRHYWPKQGRQNLPAPRPISSSSTYQ